MLSPTQPTGLVIVDLDFQTNQYFVSSSNNASLEDENFALNLCTTTNPNSELYYFNEFFLIFSLNLLPSILLFFGLLLLTFKSSYF